MNDQQNVNFSPDIISHAFITWFKEEGAQIKGTTDVNNFQKVCFMAGVECASQIILSSVSGVGSLAENNMKKHTTTTSAPGIFNIIRNILTKGASQQSPSSEPQAKIFDA